MPNTDNVLEINCETGEVIERQLTEAEIEVRLQDAAKAKEKADADAAIKVAKANLLDRLGITESEAALLLS